MRGEKEVLSVSRTYFFNCAKGARARIVKLELRLSKQLVTCWVVWLFLFTTITASLGVLKMCSYFWRRYILGRVLALGLCENFMNQFNFETVL